MSIFPRSEYEAIDTAGLLILSGSIRLFHIPIFSTDAFHSTWRGSYGIWEDYICAT